MFFELGRIKSQFSKSRNPKTFHVCKHLIFKTFISHEPKRPFSKITRRFIRVKRRFILPKRRFIFLKNSNYLTLLPFRETILWYYQLGATLTLCPELTSFRLSARELCEAAREGKRQKRHFALKGQKRKLERRFLPIEKKVLSLHTKF